tara:strand:+ start:494 stop:694 length:201 start_codon:yes stop_codon:yes gene_type:complete
MKTKTKRTILEWAILISISLTVCALIQGVGPAFKALGVIVLFFGAWTVAIMGSIAISRTVFKDPEE